ncbi:MAG: hypothetical protein IJV48_04890 [Ruminococcus sp.]|nr:hypothetical protein [Ruminococcus sp.]
MVKKLIKYDFSSYFRLLLPVQLIILGFALLNRTIQFFEPVRSANPEGFMKTFGTVYNGFFVSTLVLYIISIFVCLLMTVIVGIVRFYQGMYTNEGYLSHTLPVTPSQHICAKLLSSVIFFFGGLLAIFVSFMIITAGNVNIEVFKAFFYLMHKLFQDYGLNGGFYILEIVLLMICMLIRTYLKLFFCISVGQLAKRKKVLLAFGVYFGIYVARQMIGTVFIIITMVGYDLVARILDWLTKNAVISNHIVVSVFILFEAILALVYFLFTKYIMSKKLNLT